MSETRASKVKDDIVGGSSGSKSGRGLAGDGAAQP